MTSEDSEVSLKNGVPAINVEDTGRGFDNLGIIKEDEPTINGVEQTHNVKGVELNRLGGKRSSSVSWGDVKTVSLLTQLCPMYRKRDICKSCRPRSDAALGGV